ncbi:MAG TPA: helix-turn-helix domain-containing protein [Streptosporangiaceae bacterium]|jgi:transcriptional regulator with XRE-family HTH domain
MRDGAFGPVTIPAAFWTSPDVIGALTRRDIGELFGLIKQRTGLSQNRIGIATGLAQGRVSDISNGKYHVKTIKVLARIADGLDMPRPARAALGLATSPGTTPARPARDTADASQAPAPGTQYPATAEQAIDAASYLWQADTARSQHILAAQLEPAAWNAAALTWLLGQPDDILPGETSQGRAVGHTDVMRVRASSALFAELDNRFGGAHARRSLLHFLSRDAAALLSGHYTDATGRELFAAVSEACLLAAWTSYDCGLHGLAQRYFIQALRLAQSAADRHLACSVMSAMSHQANYLGHLTEAVNLARAAREGLRDQATPALTAQFLAMEARGLASSGDTRGCHAALAAAERAFEIPEPGRDPEFISYFNEAELAAEFAHCHRDLGNARRAAHHAALAAPSDGQYARSDFIVSIVLADALADQDQPEQACHAALTALDTGQTVTSARCVAYVRDFRRRLHRFGDLAVVRDFTEHAAGHALWIKAA